jgi:multidrug efflux pump subunit AcrA (membrane-fusion protein)
MRRKCRFFYFIPVCVALISGAGCNTANSQTAGPQDPPPPLVTVAEAAAGDVPIYLDEIGKSGAFESVTVTPQVGGRITERHFEDGANLQRASSSL